MNKTDGMQCAENFEEQYEFARKTHSNLPSLNDLDELLEIRDSVQRERISTVRPIRVAVSSSLRWINGWTGQLHDLVMPNPQNAIAIQEASTLSDQDKEQVHEALDWIMFRNRTWSLLLISRDDEAEAKFLSELVDEWKVRRERLRKILSQVSSAWEEKMSKPAKKEERINYTG